MPPRLRIAYIMLIKMKEYVLAFPAGLEQWKGVFVSPLFKIPVAAEISV